jgi:hypothetical protein
MAVSKRTRFEVLRRDEFTCRYCRSTTSELTVDHVTPVALGGTDDPSNLVAACRDCNAGKGSTGPDETTVADVDQDALRWAQALEKAAEITEAKAADARAVTSRFEQHWLLRDPWAHLPNDWQLTVLQFRSLGLSTDALCDAVDIANQRPGVVSSGRFRYFCGICWTQVRDLQRMALDILGTESPRGTV